MLKHITVITDYMLVHSLAPACDGLSGLLISSRY